MINGEILKNAVISGANNISVQKNRINDLNIFLFLTVIQVQICL